MTPMAAAAPPAPAAPPSSGTTLPSAQPTRVPELYDQGTTRRDSVAADRWTARGTAKVTGDVTVGDARFEGTVSVGGKVTATQLRSNGLLEVAGPVDVRGGFTATGEVKAAAALHAGEADLRGSVRIDGAVSVDRLLSSRGTLEVPSLAAGAVVVAGAVSIPGDLSAPSVVTRLTADSLFGTIRGTTVELRAKVPNLVEKVLLRHVTVTAQRIEADSVVIEGASVAFVRAPRITLGRGSHVTAYEGTVVARHPSARVGFESKSPPPYGLRR